MVWSINQSIDAAAPRSIQSAAWRLTRAQQGVISRRQLLELGFSARAIEHRIKRGRLHPLFSGVYAVGRKTVTFEGRWMAGVLVAGSAAALSHRSAAMLWGILDVYPGTIHVSVPRGSSCARGIEEIRTHRRDVLRQEDVTRHRNIPVTTPACTIIDLATCDSESRVERAINEADVLDLIDPEALRAEVGELVPRPGIAIVRRILDRYTFALTRSELERLFLPIARRAGLPLPETGCWVNGFEVDFYWPELGLVVETDSLRYHRTAAKQARDRIRDQVHFAAGLVPLRYTHWQVAHEKKWVESNLRAVAERLIAQRRSGLPVAPAK